MNNNQRSGNNSHNGYRGGKRNQDPNYDRYDSDYNGNRRQNADYDGYDSEYNGNRRQNPDYDGNFDSGAKGNLRQDANINRDSNRDENSDPKANTDWEQEYYNLDWFMMKKVYFWRMTSGILACLLFLAIAPWTILAYKYLSKEENSGVQESASSAPLSTEPKDPSATPNGTAHGYGEKEDEANSSNGNVRLELMDDAPSGIEPPRFPSQGAESATSEFDFSIEPPRVSSQDANSAPSSTEFDIDSKEASIPYTK